MKSKSQTNEHSQFEKLVAVKIYQLADQLARAANDLFEVQSGVRFTDVRILTQLSEEEGLSVAEIGRRAKVDKAWISRLVRQLEEKGLVERTPDETDTRSVKIYLTRSGKQLQADLLAIATEHERSVMASIDRATFVKLIDEVSRNLDRSSPSI